MSQSHKDAQYWKVLDTVIRLEVAKGHLGWKVTELSRQSGVGRPLIYYYFGKSKDEIVHTALSIIGDEFFGLSSERLELWKEGKVLSSVLKTRELIARAPHVPQFYFHWRHQKGPIADHFRKLERRYLLKISQLLGKSNPIEAEALFSIFFGLVLLPELKDETLRAVIQRLPLSRS